MAPAASIYPRTPSSPVSTIVGGLKFGCGMVLVIGPSYHMAIGALASLPRVKVTGVLAMEPRGLARAIGIGAVAGL